MKRAAYVVLFDGACRIAAVSSFDGAWIAIACLLVCLKSCRPTEPRRLGRAHR